MDPAIAELLRSGSVPGLPALAVGLVAWLYLRGFRVLHARSPERFPAWVDRRSLRCQINREDRRLSWTGNYLQFDELAPGDTIALDFPVVETTEEHTTLSRTDKEQTYKCTFRGNTLVDISPRDDAASSYPLYLRDHLKGKVAPRKTITRFVASKPLLRW